MSKLESLRNEYFNLCEEFERASNYMHFVDRLIREKRKEIEELESRSWIKYNGEIYHICYEELKRPQRSILLKDIRNGNLVIKIDSRLTPKERQEELHIILKRKKCLEYYGGAR